MILRSAVGGVARWRFPAICVLVSAALSLPALLSAYMADDYFFTGAAIPVDAPLGYYDFTEQNVATEIQHWWTSADFKMRFFRPLASLTLHLDFAAFGGSPPLAHLHSLAWFVLLLVGGFRVLGALLPVRSAKWAALLYSLSVIHAWSAGWIAARHAVMGGAFAVWAALAYLAWRRRGRARDLMAAAGLFVLGLASSEVAWALTGFAIAFEVGRSEQPWSARLRALAPILALALVYLVLYEALGYGTRGSNAYNDPLAQPGDFLLQLGPKALALIGALVLGVPAALRMVPGIGHVCLVAGAAGLGLLIAAALLVRRRLDGDQRRTAWWLTLAAGLTSFPAVAGIAMGREFALTGLAGLAVVALLLPALFGAEARRGRRVLLRTVGVLLFAGALVLSPLARVGMGFVILEHSRLARQLGESETGCAAGAHVIVLSGDFELPIAYAPHLVAEHQGRFFASWHQLAVTREPVTIARPSAERLVVSSTGPLVDTLLLRADDDPLVAGEVIDHRPLGIEILAATAAGPTEIAVTFKSPETADAVCALETVGGRLQPIELPSVGQSITVTYQPLIE